MEAWETIRDQRQEKLNKIINELKDEFVGLVLVGTYDANIDDDGESTTVTLISSGGNWHAQNGMINYLNRKRNHIAIIEAEERYAE